MPIASQFLKTCLKSTDIVPKYSAIRWTIKKRTAVSNCTHQEHEKLTTWPSFIHGRFNKKSNSDVLFFIKT